MPIQSKSIGTQITNPRETYTDGGGVQRPVYEPAYITTGRKVVDKIRRFGNGPETFHGMPIQQGAGSLEFLFDPAGAVGKADDAANLAKNIDKIKNKGDELARYKLRRKVNKQPEATKRIFRNADKHFPNENDFYDIESNINYVENRINGDDNQYMDILGRRGDLDGVKHPKVEYKYEELPF